MSGTTRAIYLKLRTRKGDVQVAATLEHFVEVFFQGREGGGPYEYIVLDLLAPWGALGDAVRVPTPFVGGRRQAHRGTEVQAAIKALNEPRITSQSVLTTLEYMETLALEVKHLTLAWIKAHVGTEGNEQADQAAC